MIIIILLFFWSAVQVNCPLYVVHVMSKSAAEAVLDAKRRGGYHGNTACQLAALAACVRIAVKATIAHIPKSVKLFCSPYSTDLQWSSVLRCWLRIHQSPLHQKFQWCVFLDSIHNTTNDLFIQHFNPPHKSLTIHVHVLDNVCVE